MFRIALLCFEGTSELVQGRHPGSALGDYHAYVIESAYDRFCIFEGDFRSFCPTFEFLCVLLFLRFRQGDLPCGQVP